MADGDAVEGGVDSRRMDDNLQEHVEPSSTKNCLADLFEIICPAESVLIAAVGCWLYTLGAPEKKPPSVNHGTRFSS
jgi:hypothetical protein